MTRTISRPFGRPAVQSSTQAPAQANDAEQPSITDFVLRDTSDDTPHAIHPHAAAYATSQAHPQAPMRIATGSVHNAPGRPKPATAEERAAYMRMRNAQMHALEAGANGAGLNRSQTTAASYAETARNVDPAFRVAPTATYDANALNQAQDTSRQATVQTPANASSQVPPSPAASEESALEPAQRPLAPQQQNLGSPLVLQPPRRTSSLAASVRAPAVDSSGQRQELEISVTSSSGRSVTIRLFAP